MFELYLYLKIKWMGKDIIKNVISIELWKYNLKNVIVF